MHLAQLTEFGSWRRPRTAQKRKEGVAPSLLSVHKYEYLASLFIYYIATICVYAYASLAQYACKLYVRAPSCEVLALCFYVVLTTVPKCYISHYATPTQVILYSGCSSSNSLSSPPVKSLTHSTTSFNSFITARLY